jgi:hypothetical protein
MGEKCTGGDMDTSLRKLSCATLGFLFLGLGLPLYGYQEAKPEPCKVKMVKPSRPPLKSQAREIVIQVDNYLKGYDRHVLVSAEDQQLVLWRCAGCKFRVVSLLPELDDKDLPEEVRKHLEKFREGGPFYRMFPDTRDPDDARGRFFSKLSSGPLLPDAASKKPDRRYTFKATLWIQQSGKVCELDPHIITMQGDGP